MAWMSHMGVPGPARILIMLQSHSIDTGKPEQMHGSLPDPWTVFDLARVGVINCELLEVWQIRFVQSQNTCRERFAFPQFCLVKAFMARVRQFLVFNQRI